MESSMKVPQKTKNRLLCNVAIPLLGIYLKEYVQGYNRSTYTPMFIAVLFTIAKLWKQTRCPTTDKLNKRKCGIYTQWSIINP
jgi:hypothetical protein